MSDKNNNQQSKPNNNQTSNSSSTHTVQSVPKPPQSKLPRDAYNWRTVKSESGLSVMKEVVLEKFSTERKADSD